MKFSIITFTLYLFFVSCNTKEIAENEVEKSFVNNNPNSRFNLEQNEYMQFRRNYFHDKTLEENSDQFYEFMERNPIKMDNTYSLNPNYDKGFEKLRLLDSIGNLNLQTWENLSETKDSTIHIRGNIYQLDIEYIIDRYKIEIKDKDKSILASFNFLNDFPPNLSYYVFDVDGDNQDEIIAMNSWYIINGDNYDFSIIEINEN
jgi:hypothetical protein